MTGDKQQIDVLHNPEQNRFEVQLDGDIAQADYEMDGSTITFTHTRVPEEYKGQGIASQLARAALEYAKNQEYKVQAQCAYMASYIDRHPEYQFMTQGK